MKVLSYVFSITLMWLLVSCATKQKDKHIEASSFTVEPIALSQDDKAQLDTATFASGCFWCTEAVFERVKGVKSVVSGYAGGDQPNPTYELVSAGQTDHAESVQVYYDPEQVSYQTLLEVFFATHDPTQLNRQGPDIGKQYRSAIFFHDEEQKEAATAYMQELDRSGKYEKPVVTEINLYTEFYEAEDYHQNYYEHHPENPYIINVTKPKVEKFEKQFKDLLKKEVSS